MGFNCCRGRNLPLPQQELSGRGALNNRINTRNQEYQTLITKADAPAILCLIRCAIITRLQASLRNIVTNQKESNFDELVNSDVKRNVGS